MLSLQPAEAVPNQQRGGDVRQEDGRKKTGKVTPGARQGSGKMA